MSIHARWLWLLSVALVVFSQPPAATAGARGVRDGANLFGKTDITEARIEELHQQYGVDLYIETAPTVPANRVGELKQLGANKFFPMWAEERALAAGADGIYILVCSSPKHIEVIAGTEAEASFDKRARDKVRKALTKSLDRDRKTALEETVNLIRDHYASKEEAAKRGGWLWLVWVMLAILGAWLAVALIRRVRGDKAVTPPTAISSAALAGQSIYQSVVHKTPDPATADQTTLPYPPPESNPQGTVHG
jgi:hypothetical protein